MLATAAAALVDMEVRLEGPKWRVEVERGLIPFTVPLLLLELVGEGMNMPGSRKENSGMVGEPTEVILGDWGGCSCGGGGGGREAGPV